MTLAELELRRAYFAAIRRLRELTPSELADERFTDDQERIVVGAIRAGLASIAANSAQPLPPVRTGKGLMQWAGHIWTRRKEWSETMCIVSAQPIHKGNLVYRTDGRRDRVLARVWDHGGR